MSTYYVNAGSRRNGVQLCLYALLSSLLLIFSLPAAFAATFTWTNGGGDGLWSNPANWSVSSTDADGLPDADDTVTFTSSSGAPSTIDGDYNIAQLQIFNTYTGTVNLGTHTLQTFGTLFIYSAWQFEAGTGKVIISGSGNITCNVSANFYDLEIDASASATLTLSQAIVVRNDLTITEIGTITSSTIIVRGNIISNDGSVEGSTNIEAAGTADQTLSGTGVLHRLRVNTTGGTLILLNDFTLSNSADKGGPYLLGSGRISSNTDTEKLILGGAASATLWMSGGSVDRLEFNFADNSADVHLASSMVVNEELTITQVDQINSGSNNLRVLGEIISNDSSVEGTAFIIADGTSDQTLSGTGSLHQLQVNTTGGHLILLNDFTLANSTGNVRLQGTGSIQSQTGTEKLIIGGSPNSATIDLGGSVDNLELDFSDPSATLVINQLLTIHADLTITQVGQLWSSPIQVLGDIISNDTSVGGFSMIIAAGTTDQTLSGSGTLHNLRVNTSGGNLVLLNDFTLANSSSTTVLEGSGRIVGNTGVEKLIIGGSNRADIDMSGSINNLEFHFADPTTDVWPRQLIRVNQELTITELDEIITGTIRVLGDIISHDSSISGFSWIEAAGTSDQYLSGTGVLHRLRVNTSGGDLRLLNDFTLANTSNATQLEGTGNIKSNTGSEKLILGGSQTTYIYLSGTIDQLEIAFDNSTVDLGISQVLTIQQELTITQVDQLGITNHFKNIQVVGDITSNDNRIDGFSQIEAVGSTDQFLSGSGVLHLLTVNKTGGDIVLANDFTIAHASSNAYLRGSGRIVPQTGVEKLIFGGSIRVVIQMTGSTDHLELNFDHPQADLIIFNTYPFTVNKDLTITQVGQIGSSSSAGSLRVLGNIIANDPEVAGYGYVEAAGTTDQTLSGTGTLHRLKVSTTGGNLKLLHDFTLSTHGNVLGVNLAGDGRIVGNTGVEKLILGGDKNIYVDMSGSVDDLEIKIAAADVLIRQPLTVNNDLTITEVAEIGAPNFAHPIRVMGNIIVNDAMIGGSSAIEAAGTADQNLSGSGGSLPHLRVSTVGGNLVLLHDFTISRFLSGSGRVVGQTGVEKLIMNSFVGAIFMDGGSVDHLEINMASSAADLSITQTLQVNLSLTITEVDQINSGTIRVLGDIISNDPSVAGSAFIEAAGTTDQHLSGTGSLHRLRVNTSGGDLLLLNDFRISNSLLGSGRIAGYSGTEKLIMAGTSGFISMDGGSVDHLEINMATSGSDLSVSRTLQVNRSLTITEVDQISSGIIQVLGDIISNDPSIGGSSYIEAAGTSDQFLSGTGVLHRLRANTTGGNLVLLHDFALNGSVTSLQGSGRIASNTGVEKLIIQGSSPTISMNGGTVDNLEIDLVDNTKDLNITQHFTVNQDLTITQVDQIGSWNIRVKGNIIANDPDIGGSGMIEAIGTTDQTLSGSGVLHRLRVNTTGGSLILPADFTLTGPGTILDGTGRIASSTGVEMLTIGGNFATISLFGGSIDNLEIDLPTSTHDLNVFQTLTINQDLIITQVDQINSRNIEVAGNVIATDNSVGGASKIVLTGAGTNSFTGPGGGTFPGLIIRKAGASDVALLGSSEFFSSRIQVEEGIFQLNGQTISGGAGLWVLDGGTLAGNGTIHGQTVIYGGGSMDPGGSPGCITIEGDCIFQFSSHYLLDIDGNTPCTQYDQVIVNGNISISGAQLNGVTTTVPTGPITIFENNLTNPVSGFGFNGLPEGSCVTLGNWTYRISYQGGDGNDITLDPDTAPIAACQDITVNLDGTGSATIPENAVNLGSTGGCGGLTFDTDITSFTCADVPAKTVNMQVTDANNESSSCTATVTIQDLTAPNALCQDISIQLDAAGGATITAADLDAGSSDNCGIADRTIDQAAFDCSQLGANTVTLTVDDDFGNQSTCQSTVTVQDLIAPTALCQDISIQLSVDGQGTTTAAEIDNGSSDNCGIATRTIDQAAFDCTHLGTNTITLTVEDLDGNQSSCQATVTVSTIDTDGDGVLDCDDNCPTTPNPNQSDSDKDGIGNACDPCNNSQGGGSCDDGDPCTIDDTLDAFCNCVGVEQDTDGDGILDGCDTCLGDDATGDSDGDGVCDDLDTCPGSDDNTDSDGDGIADGCDLCQGDDTTGDSDGDGICDADDQCPGGDDTVDSDGDGVPDACDQCPGARDDIDTDGDGVCNELDACQGHDDNLDEDGDGVPDGCDQCPGFDDLEDVNNNGIPDGCDPCLGTDLSIDAGSCQAVYMGYAPAECTDLTAVVSGGVSPYSYIWSTGETTSTISVCPTATTTYSVSVTDDEGCEATDQVIVEVINVQCGNNKVEICQNGEIKCIQNNKVQQQLDSGASLGACGITPCAGVGKIAVAPTISSASKTAPDFAIFPNPARQKIWIELGDFLDQTIQLDLYDKLGRRVWSKHINNLQLPLQQVDVHQLGYGPYLLQLRTADRVLTRRLVVVE